jgi:DNA primase
VEFWSKNVLAICGTAFSSNQMALIYRTGISKILIMMDNDDAGNKATERILTKIKSFGFDGKQVLLPTGKDPEDYVRSVQTDINLLIQPQLDQEVIELK